MADWLVYVVKLARHWFATRIFATSGGARTEVSLYVKEISMLAAYTCWWVFEMKIRPGDGLVDILYSM